jgi:hypothetical protein
LGPIAAIAAASLALERAAIVTLAPAFAAARAVARPMPELPPTTSTFLSVIEIMSQSPRSRVATLTRVITTCKGVAAH